VPGEGLQPKTPALGARLLAPGRVRARAADANPQGGRCAAASLMSFLRHGEIYRTISSASAPLPGRPREDRSRPHRRDEFPAGYSLAGCTPAVPASASPADAHLVRKGFWSTMQFKRTVRSALTVCLTPGDKPRKLSAMMFYVYRMCLKC